MADPSQVSDRPILLFLAFVAALEIGFFVVAWITGAEVGENYLPTLLSAKVTFISLLTATLTFLYRTFWDEVKNLPKTAPTASESDGTGVDRATATVRNAAVVAHYQLYTVMLLAAIFSTFAAIVADIFIALGHTGTILRSVSLSTIATAIVVLIVFVSYFARRTVGEMRAVLGAGSHG